MQHRALASAQDVCVIAVALVLVVLFLILNGRQSNMSANNTQYMKLFGTICNNAVVMARCACVACNSCTCACSCRAIPEMEEIGW